MHNTDASSSDCPFVRAGTEWTSKQPDEEAQMPEAKENITGTARNAQKVCIVGASGKLGQNMIEHALNRGHEVVAVCRERSVPKLDRFKGRITVMAGMTDDRDVIGRAAAGC